MKSLKYLSFAVLLVTLTGIGLGQEPLNQPVSNEVAAGPLKTPEQNHLLLPEGFKISNLRVKLVKLPDDPRWFVIFESSSDKAKAQPPITSGTISSSGSTREKDDFQGQDPFSRPIQVLPSKWLEKMTSLSDNKIDLSISYRLWGEVTTYQQQNFILPTLVTTESVFGGDAGEKAADRNKSGKQGLTALEAAVGGGGKSPQPSSSSKPQDSSAITENLRNALLAIPRPRMLELPEDLTRAQTAENQTPGSSEEQPTAQKSADEKTADESKWKDGFMVIDRIGRVIYNQETQRYLFTFEADGQSLAEPPVTLHPCRLLEDIGKIASQSVRQIKFRVSGQITKYRGRDYLLLRKALIVQSKGNFES